MQIEISKTDYKALLELTEKCVGIIQKSPNTSIREFNVARRLRLVKKKIERKNNNKI